MGEHDKCRCMAGTTRVFESGGRFLVISAAINWGDNDERADWAGEKSFCSFGCLRDWAAEMSVNHDGRVVTDG